MPGLRVGSLVSRRYHKGACTVVWYQQHTEGGRHTDDDALALKLLGDVDLVARRGLDKLNVGDGIANLDISTGRRLEGTGSAKGTRGDCCESTGGEHVDGLCVVRVGCVIVWGCS